MNGPMTHTEFIAKFQQNRNAFGVNWVAAFRAQSLLPWNYRIAWNCLSIFEWSLLLGGLALLIFKHWLIGICLVFFSVAIVMPTSRKTACEFVLEHSLENEIFWKLMWDGGVIQENTISESV
ncbi:MAG TPA: hypothetical protein VGN23_00125 [Verrucomicrobiae bacterium]|jgi:hypothetical protein